MNNLEFVGSNAIDTKNNYVIPTWTAKYYYEDDYILNFCNYGIIFHDKIHWFEIGTNELVLTTDKHDDMFEVASERHAMLIRNLNDNNVDLCTINNIRNDKTYTSKAAVKAKSDREDEENGRLAKKFEEYMKQFEESGNRVHYAKLYEFFDTLDETDET